MYRYRGGAHQGKRHHQRDHSIALFDGSTPKTRAVVISSWYPISITGRGHSIKIAALVHPENAEDVAHRIVGIVKRVVMSFSKVVS